MTRRSGETTFLLRRWSTPPAARCGLGALALIVAVATGCARQTLILPVSIEPEVLQAGARPGSVRSYESAVHAVASIMVAELGLPLPQRLTVFVYPSRAAYAAGLASVGRMSPQRAEKIAAYSVGLGQHRRLFINDEALRGACPSVWLAVLAHELTHSAQYELSGGRRGRSEQWLREGMADWVAVRVLERLGETTFPRRRERALGEVALAWSGREDTRFDLIELGGPLGWERRHLGSGQLTYRLAFLATDALIHRSGLDKLIDYFRAFADSDDRFNHFQAAFGVSLEEFEIDALRRIRTDLRGRDWTPLDEPPSPPDSAREARTLDAVEPCVGGAH